SLIYFDFQNGTVNNGFVLESFSPKIVNGQHFHTNGETNHTEEPKGEEKIEEKDDPWALPELDDKNNVKWKDLNTSGRLKRVATVIIRIILLIGLLYLFICSLDFLSSAFTLLGGKAAGQALGNSVLLQNPVAGLMIGVLVTVLVQSSSTSTSIVVSMVSSGILTVRFAIPIIMGANIGTTVTNSIVSLGQVGDRSQFRRAFAAATLHDFFNWLCVLVLLPIEVASGYLYHLTSVLVADINSDPNAENPEFLKAITSPFTKTIIELDKDIIKAIANGDSLTDEDTILKSCCKKETDISYELLNTTLSDCSDMSKGDVIFCDTSSGFATVNSTVRNSTCFSLCDHLFASSGLSDSESGIIMLIVALLTLCICLVLIVKLLHSLISGQIATVIKKIMNAKFPGHCAFLTGYVAIFVGAGLTILVQSSSIFTSTMTPLVGVGVVSIENLFPLTLGANIGTTGTSVLAALASPGSGFKNALQISFCHLFFNLTGIFVWYGIPPMRKVPIGAAKWMGETTEKYRWFAFVHIFTAFLIFPSFIFALSLGGWEVLVGVGSPIVLVVIFVVIVKILQAKKPGVLPKVLQNWHFLPEFMRSLEPLDRIVIKLKNKCSKGKRNQNEVKTNDKMRI
ncbi:sodium-dependent phosphate transport protein 2B, partial [Patella vulgata]|uniref:sodium-dependent phosphate transport protein 2B n=1 Tax=Patella vulgata TaxID=6465 RepID=UPI0021807AF7